MSGTVYTDIDIQNFIDQKIISCNEKINQNSQIQPSSFDLRCGFGKKVWHIPYSSIPRGDMMEFLESKSTHSFILNEKRFFHKNSVYVFELEESLNLPKNICAKANPKSTTGRLDIHSRLLTENGQYYDKVKEGYNGKLFLELISHSFDLFVTPGHSFNQIRFFENPEKLNQQALEYLARSEDILYNFSKKSKNFQKINLEAIDPKNFIFDGLVYLTLELNKEDPGYMARGDAPPIDLSLKNKSHPFSKYFLKVNLNDEGLALMPNSFYLLKTNEVISIPLDHCAEMVDISTELGEYRAHYAGFFDPGFKSIGIVEVRNTGRAPALFRDKMKLTSLEFYNLIEKPSKTYGNQIGSNYQGQTKVTPAKFFNMNE